MRSRSNFCEISDILISFSFTQAVKDWAEFLLSSAKENNRVVGFLDGYYDAGLFWVDWLIVDSKFRGNGVAISLMNYLEKKLKKEKIHKIWCDSRTNNKESVPLLKKLKFQKITKIKNHWYKQDFYLWQKYL